MLQKNLTLNIGDKISAHRPVYNGTQEIVPEEKVIRPFIILDIKDDELLVVSVTSNGENRHNLEIGPYSYARTNDLYIIKTSDIVTCYCTLDKLVIDELYNTIYSYINKNDILYKFKIRKWFLMAYKKHLLEQKKSKGILEDFIQGDIVYTYDLKNKKYIIDEILDDGYYAYRIDDKNKFDFTNRIKLNKESLFILDSHFEVDEYLKEKNSCIKYKGNIKSKYNGKVRVFKENDIVVYKGKEYFVISISANGNVICIPYNDNYWLSEIITIKNKEVDFLRHVKKKELLNILKSLLNNLTIQANNQYQHNISLKIKRLNIDD